MVQNESSNNDSSVEVEVEPIVHQNPAKGVPCGKYKLVGWAIDTTGRRLIDEICQIAAHMPRNCFSQYIMPFGDLNPVFRRKHQIVVVNTDRYRMLKNMKNNKYVKTKSEISALTDFVKWLEDNQGDASDGIILVYHEVNKTSPGMLLEALGRCFLLDRFSKVVKGFANAFNIARAKCANITKAFNLKILSRVLLNKEEDFSSAVDRARASYELCAHLAQGERLDLDNKASGDSTASEPHLIEFVCPYTNTIGVEQEEIAQLKVFLQRQNTFKPVFGALLRASRVERQHASRLRKLLAENNINFDKLKAAYETGAKEGLDKVLKAELFQVANAKEKDLDELLEILDCFFDPEKKAVRPKPRFPTNNNRRPYRKSFSHKRSSASESSPNASSDNPAGSASETSPRSEEEKDKPQSETDTESQQPVKTEANQEAVVAVQ